jgi:hypothetical protein
LFLFVDGFLKLQKSCLCSFFKKSCYLRIFFGDIRCVYVVLCASLNF